MNKFNFNPPNGLLDTNIYPTNPTTEAEARGQIQDPLNQLKDYLNLFSESFIISGKVNGYIKLPNGFILQWGVVTSWAGGKLWVPFPITFNNQVFSIVITSLQTGGSTANNTVDSFILGGFNMNSSVNSLETFWIAIGV